MDNHHPLIAQFSSLSVSEAQGEGRGQESTGQEATDQSLRVLVAGVMSGDVNQQTSCAGKLRRMTTWKAPPIGQLVAAGVVPCMVQLLAANNTPALQFEAAWVLTNITSGASDHTRVVVEHGAVPLLIHLLTSPVDDVRELAVWALGNIAGDSPPFRDYVLQHGALNPLLQLITVTNSPSMLTNATWTLSNLFRGNPPPEYARVRPALPYLGRLIYSQDDSVVAAVCRTLSYLTRGSSNHRIQDVIETGVCRRLVELLTSTSNSVVAPALRTVGKLVTGNCQQTQIMINFNILTALPPLLSSARMRIVRETCRVVGNIALGNRMQKQAVIEANIIPPLISLLASPDADVRWQVLRALANTTSSGTDGQVQYVVSHGCITSLCCLLAISNLPKEIKRILRCLDKILEVGESSTPNRYATMVAEHPGSLPLLERLRQLEAHGDVATRAADILQRYFGNGVATEELSDGDMMNLN